MFFYRAICVTNPCNYFTNSKVHLLQLIFHGFVSQPANETAQHLWWTFTAGASPILAKLQILCSSPFLPKKNMRKSAQIVTKDKLQHLCEISFYKKVIFFLCYDVVLIFEAFNAGLKLNSLTKTNPNKINL